VQAVAAQLRIITEDELRNFVRGRLELDAQADVIGAIANDDRAQAIVLQEIKSARSGDDERSLAAPQDEIARRPIMEPELNKVEARAGDRNKLNVRVLLISGAIAAVIAVIALGYAAAV
jgi:anti-sigma factor RsiW